MYFRTVDGLGLNAPVIDFDRAIRLNDFLARWLGWEAHRGRIFGLLGFTSPPAARDFAAAVARWQLSQGLTPADGILGACTWSRMRVALSLGPLLPCVTNFRFMNTGRTHADNCCASCPMNLGVGVNFGGGPTASNGMELQFTISGHRPGLEYDITRTRRNSIWERRAGAWTRIESDPMGTNDDHHDRDECLRPRNNRIYVIDTPGFPGAVLPIASGIVFTGLTGASTHADATEVVFRLNFGEWAIARSRTEGIPWTRISGLFYWHSITWLTRNAAGQWVIDRSRCRIAPGSLSAAVINSAPAIT